MATSTTHGEWIVAANVADVQPGQCKIVDIAGQSIGLYNVNGEYRAVLNLCPHAFAPICQGAIRGSTKPTSTPGEYLWHRDGEFVACPWHGWEFDLLTGESLVDRRRLKLFPVRREDDQLSVYVSLRPPRSGAT